MEDTLSVRYYPDKKSRKRRFYRRITILVSIGVIVNLAVLTIHVLHLNGVSLRAMFRKEPAPLMKSQDTVKFNFDHTPFMYSGHSFPKDSVDDMLSRESHHEVLISKMNADNPDTTKVDVTSHQVKHGETLYSIAQQHGVSVESIKAANGLDDDDISEGLTLKIIKGKTTLGYYGIDVSNWQNSIDWSEVHSDTLPHRLKFFIVKASQGTGITDHYFRHNWENARSKSTHVGAYHFFISNEDPILQAQNYIKNVSLVKGDIRPIIDVELDCGGCSTLQTPKAQLVTNLKKFIKVIEAHYHVKPILYTYSSFYEMYLKGNFDEYTYWIARYSSTPPTGMSIGSAEQMSKPVISMWQFTSAEKIRGVVGNVDMSFLPECYLDSVICK
jgi:lysozyme